MKNRYKVQINDLNWVIKFVKSENEKLDKACGITYKEDCKIYISKDLTPQLRKRTIRHELTHAFVWSYGLENISVRKYEEEDLCNFVETFSEQICEMTNYINEGR